MASDTNTKTLLNKVRNLGRGLPVYGRPGQLTNPFAVQKKRSYHPARLLLLIVGANLIPLLLLIFALVFLGQYRTNLISSELKLLQTQSELYAVLIREAVANAGDESPYDAMQSAAKNIFQRAGVKSGLRLVLFAEDGGLLADSWQHDPDINRILYKREDFRERATEGLLSLFYKLFAVNYNLPPYPDAEGYVAETYPGVSEAMKGRTHLSVWSAAKSQLVFSSALPLTKDGQVIAVLSVTKLARDLDKAITELKTDIFRMFFIVLLLSAALSVLLVNAITNPLRRLAKAAELVRTGQGDAAAIPDMSARGDEIGEVSIALRGLVRALSERMTTIERFAADVSHELKNPLTSMHSALETLKNIKSTSDRKELMSILETDVRRLDRLVTDISRASRLDVELARESAHALNLVDLLSKIAETYRLRGELSANDDLTMPQIVWDDGGFEEALVFGNADRLTQIMTNLIDNAMSFCPHGGQVTIRLKRENGESWHIMVEDEGPGIPEGKTEKIFERFYTERDGKELFGQHSGLGLSIARKIAEAHEGRLTASNRMHGADILGARFTFILPGLREEDL